MAQQAAAPRCAMEPRCAAPLPAALAAPLRAVPVLGAVVWPQKARGPAALDRIALDRTALD